MDTTFTHNDRAKGTVIFPNRQSPACAVVSTLIHGISHARREELQPCPRGSARGEPFGRAVSEITPRPRPPIRPALVVLAERSQLAALGCLVAIGRPFRLLLTALALEHVQFCSHPNTELNRSESRISNAWPISFRPKPPERIPAPYFSHRLNFSRRAQIFSESDNPTSLASSSSRGLARCVSLYKAGASHFWILYAFAR